MSLKAFHICFIVLSSSLAFGFGLWALQNFEPGSGPSLASAFGGFVVSLSLLGYGSWFLRKMRAPRRP